jgi:hypothetical protein
VVPADKVDTLRGGRKGDPQQKVVRKFIGGGNSKDRCVVKIGFQKTSLFFKVIGKREQIPTTTATVFLGPQGGSKKERFQQTRSTHSRAGEKETLNNKL